MDDIHDPLVIARELEKAHAGIDFAETIMMLRNIRHKTQEEIDYDEAMVELEEWLKSDQ